MSLYGQIWMIWFSVPTSVRQKPRERRELGSASAILSREGLLGLRRRVPGFSR